MKARAAFATRQPELKVGDIIFIDECGVKTGMQRTHARAKRGERAFGLKPDRDTKTLSLIGAMGVDGFVASQLLDGPMCKPNFLEFFEQNLLAHLKPGQAVVLDNLNTHHCKEIKALAERHGIILLYTPPYSPQFNPIEEAWSKLKSYLRKQTARTVSTLVAEVAEGIRRITTTNIAGWIRHAGYIL